MEVKLAECMGFCFGVKRAVDTVYEQIKKGKTIYTYGPVVNNEEVVKELAEKGVRVLWSKEELMGLSSGSVIIRAHGVPEEIYHILKERNLECIDATCPFVKRIHNIVEKESGEGRHIVIVGNAGHPEVEGIIGWCRGPVTVLKDLSEAEDFRPPEREKLCVVSQTTYNYNKFHNIVEILEKKGYNSSVVNTICNATEERQCAAKALAAEADVMIIIGGKHSSNTRKLYEICAEECTHTYFIQTLDDLHLELPKSVRLVGITAGASTPNKLIEEVQRYVRINF
ncbi:4-hydroxy-3-methylbut-2-enyl diphosphate reductase [Acetatifactor aquisgranensis]|uniref:4-hydroxy-3-methylbut-2-enyl diphosphate reductase n=1 Tax=Acetatifactor aquisgranensis TaxID=2941233 RepID=UPI00203E57C9|nr:4-hydroxy-3-methylbut-2-enyl diphosphate reductase [Acetatifactor aquisgranensis]MCI8543547.1 4-hydroxy-3-methylbut-2-enyl diphosphate reductase [Lachnospiraceae bacterium]